MQCLYQRTSTILALMIFHMSNHIKIFSCMSSYMKFQVLLCRTFVTTQFTLKWLDLIVHLSMFNHVCFHDELSHFIGFSPVRIRECASNFNAEKNSLDIIHIEKAIFRHCVCTYVLPRNHCVGNMLGKLHIQTFFLDTSSDTDLSRI